MMLLASMQECQNCGWKGMSGEGGFTCPDCSIAWQEVSLMIPAERIREALDAIAPVLRPFVPEDEERKAQRKAENDGRRS